MAFNIQSFVSNVSKNGFARTSDFFAEVSAPIPDLGAARDLTFRIEATNIPMRTVQSIDYKDYGYPYKIGGLPNSVEIEMQILCSPDLRERDFFLKWQDLIVGDHRTNTSPNSNQFEIGYYNDYIGGVRIYQLNTEGLKTYEVELIEAYPMNVQGISKSWAQTDIQRMSVTMAYRYFKEKQISEYAVAPKIDVERAFRNSQFSQQ